MNLANFLADEYERGIRAGSAAGARSAILSTWQIGTGEAPSNDGAIATLMRGYKRQRPNQPRYEESFDVGILLDWIERKWPVNAALTHETLRMKAIVLLRVTSLKRARDIAKMIKASIREAGDGSCSFRMLDEKRPGEPGRVSRQYPIFKNAERPAICAWSALSAYLEWTRGWATGELDTTFRWLDQDKPLGKDVIANISLKVMQLAGVPEQFRSHSLRMAGATRMLNQGISHEMVMRIGGWTSGEVFMRFYDRSRVPPDVAERMAGELGGADSHQDDAS